MRSSAHLVWGPILLCVLIYLGSKAIFLIFAATAGDRSEASGRTPSKVGSTSSRSQLTSNKVRKSELGAPKNSETHIVQQLLEQIDIPIIDFEETSIDEAIDFLRHRVRELEPFDSEPTLRGISFIVRKPRLEGSDAEGGLNIPNQRPLRLTYQARDVSAWHAIQHIAREADFTVEVGPTAVMIVPRR